MAIHRVTLDGEEYVMVPRRLWESMARSGSVKSKDTTKPLGQLPRQSDGTFSIEHVRISLANRIINRRKAAGLTQSQLAKLARVRVETISRLENGLHMPNVATFEKLDRALSRSEKTRAA